MISSEQTIGQPSPKRMQATAGVASIVSSTLPARRRLIRSVRPLRTCMDKLDTAIREFTLENGSWLPLEACFEPGATESMLTHAPGSFAAAAGAIDFAGVDPWLDEVALPRSWSL
jgi:hypothetical protein